MKITRLTMRTALACCAAALFVATALGQAGRPTVGSSAPDFTLQTIEGEEVTLTALRAEGPVVLIQLRGFFSTEYQCPYCTAQVGEFMNRINDFQALGANIVAVYPGPLEGLKERAEDFIRGEALPENFYLVLDPGFGFTNLYQLRWDAPNQTAHPATFVVDQAGIVQYVKISDGVADRAGVDVILDLLE